MEWLNDLAARLPAPREDEPADLRRRIVAELRDHLLSAFQRELLLTGDAEAAQRNILVRFGDPARLARKLWFDAMWEKIMSQRMTLVALVVVVLVSLGSMGLAWFLVDQARQVNLAMLEQSRAANEAVLAEARRSSGDQAAENRAANLALADETRKANLAILAKLAPAGAAASSSSTSMEWNPLKVCLFTEKEGGSPASGFEVTLSGHLLDTGKEMKVTRKTGPDGTADFGLIRPGQHSLDIVAPWGERVSPSVTVTVLPGEAQTVDIICPPALEEADIAITVDWPTELTDRGLWLVCDFNRGGRKFAGQWWSRHSDNIQFVAIEPSGKFINFDRRAFPASASLDPGQFFDPDKIIQDPARMSEINKVFGICHLHTGSSWLGRSVLLPAIPPLAKLRWPAGSYHTRRFAVARDPETHDESMPPDMLFPMLLGGIAIGADKGDEGRVSYLSANPPQAQQPQQQGRSGDRHLPAKIDIPEFTAVPGRLNEWHIALPAPLVDFLKENPAIRP